MLVTLRGQEFSCPIIGGRAFNPCLIRDEILKEFEEKRHSGICEKVFERVMKSYQGRFIRGFDYPDSLFMSQIELAVMNADLIEAFDSVMSIDREYLNKILADVLKSDKMALSIIK